MAWIKTVEDDYINSDHINVIFIRSKNGNFHTVESYEIIASQKLAMEYEIGRYDKREDAQEVLNHLITMLNMSK